MAEARRDEDPYERALHDPDFLRAVTAAYRGRWPVLDALWWWSHPGEAAPSGSPSPAARLSAMQRRVFAADGDAAGDSAVAGVIRELETEIAAERAGIGSALAAVAAAGEPGPVSAQSAAAQSAASQSATSPERGPELPEVRADGPDGPDEAPENGSAAPSVDDGATPSHRPPRSRQGRRLLLGAGLVGALLLGAVAGSQLTAANRAGAPAPSPAASSGRPAEVPVLAAQVFARGQTGQDIPRTPLPAAYDPTSFRYLGSAGWRDSDANGVTDSPYYAARGASNMVCLVVIPEGAGYLSTCTLEADFPRDGLRLSWQSTDLLPVEEDGRTTMVMDITVAWLPDSSIETRGSGRALIP